MYNKNQHDAFDLPDVNYGEIGDAMKSFEAWVLEKASCGFDVYSPTEHAIDLDNISLEEDGAQSFSANNYIACVFDNFDIVYGVIDLYEETKLRILLEINYPWEALISEANEYFCEADPFDAYDRFED